MRLIDFFIFIDIQNSFHLGQVLGMGTYGVIREAVYKPAVKKHYEERSRENCLGDQ